MSENLPCIAILASGSGTTTEAFIHATQNGVVKAKVGLVVSNNKEAGVFEVVKRMNKMYGLKIKTAHISGATHPDGPGEKGEQTLAESAAIYKEIQDGNFALVALMGYMKKVRGQLLEVYGAKKDHTSIYEARMLNTHPGPLPETAGSWGIGVQESVLKQGLKYSAHTVHVVAEGYDTGAIVAAHKVPVLPTDTPESLAASVQLVEKAYLPIDINNFLNHQNK